MSESSKLSYQELQQLRQENINSALLQPTTANHLWHMYELAILGRDAAFQKPEIGEFDTLTFMGLQAAVSKRLQESPAYVSAQVFIEAEHPQAQAS